MNRLLVLSMLAAAACDTERPVTRYLSSDGDAVEATFLKAAHADRPTLRRIRRDWSAPEEYRGYQHLRLPWFDREQPPFTTFDLQLVGAPVVGPYNPRPCRVKLGPNRVWRATPVDFIFDVVEDKDLATRMRALIGTVPINRLYEIDEQVEGFHLHFEQFSEGHNIYLKLIIDGCARVPTDRPPAHYDDGPARWELSS